MATAGLLANNSRSPQGSESLRHEPDSLVVAREHHLVCISVLDRLGDGDGDEFGVAFPDDFAVALVAGLGPAARRRLVDVLVVAVNGK